MAVGAGSSPATQDSPLPADAGVGTAAEERKESAATEQSDPRALIKQMMGSDTFQTTLLAGSFLIIKVLLATQGDVMTALAVVLPPACWPLSWELSCRLFRLLPRSSLPASMS
jgi:hypothetical protein